MNCKRHGHGCPPCCTATHQHPGLCDLAACVRLQVQSRLEGWKQPQVAALRKGQALQVTTDDVRMACDFYAMLQPDTKLATDSTTGLQGLSAPSRLGTSVSQTFVQCCIYTNYIGSFLTCRPGKLQAMHNIPQQSTNSSTLSASSPP